MAPRWGIAAASIGAGAVAALPVLVAQAWNPDRPPLPEVVALSDTAGSTPRRVEPQPRGAELIRKRRVRPDRPTEPRGRPRAADRRFEPRLAAPAARTLARAEAEPVRPQPLRAETRPAGRAAAGSHDDDAAPGRGPAPAPPPARAVDEASRADAAVPIDDDDETDDLGGDGSDDDDG
jgi:hypothetical protein